jgi:hypothetical protein
MSEHESDGLWAAKYERASDVVLREIAGERFLIVLHAGESKMFSLNGMGGWFWQQLERPSAPAELVERMLRDYDATEEVASQEVARFLGDLERKGLARRSD